MSFTHTCKLLVSAIACFTFAMGSAACGTPQSAPAVSASPEAETAGTVAIFTPSDGITLSTSTPLNTWKALTSEITDSLDSLGFGSSQISTHTASNLAAQQQQLTAFLSDNEYVRSTDANSTDAGSDAAASATGSDETTDSADSQTASDSGESSSPATSADTSASASSTDGAQTSLADEDIDYSKLTIVIAPAVAKSQDSKGYSDYTAEEKMIYDTDEYRTLDSMATTLAAVESKGASVIVMAYQIPSFTPTLFVELSDISAIARMQAQFLATKLSLVSTTESKPQAVEVLIPYDDDGSLAKEAFEGIWDVLGQYYKNGRIYSPSGLLGPDSDEDSWTQVSYKASGADDTKDEVKKRLDASAYDDVKHMNIDGILCLNDEAAQAAIDELKSLGYSGTSATVNPDISVTGIIGGIQGDKDSEKRSVPRPANSHSTENSAEQSARLIDEQKIVRATQDSADWPLVTGFGSYKSALSSVVDGSQWITGIEDRKGYASDIATAIQSLCNGTSVNDMSMKLTSVQKQTFTLPTMPEPDSTSDDSPAENSSAAQSPDSAEGAGATDDSADGTGMETTEQTMYAMELPVIGISAGNLKQALVDPGYVTAAEAGI